MEATSEERTPSCLGEGTASPTETFEASPQGVEREEAAAEAQMDRPERDGSEHDLEAGEAGAVEDMPVRPSILSITAEEREGSSESIRRAEITAVAIFAQRTSARSSWRFPSNRGQVPRYMQRAFRLKTFGLMTLQLCVVLLIAVPLRRAQLLDHLEPNDAMQSFFHQGIVYMFGVLNLVCILLLHCYKDRFPANYMLLAMTTVTSGVFWSVAYSKNFMTIMQFEILAILCITMFFATVISLMLSGLQRKLHGTTVLVMSFFPGWCMGCSAILVQRALWAPPLPLELAGACCVSAILLGILFLDVGPLLVRCDPDDFMRVIVSMNSSMMVVVSIPFFFLAFCMLRLDHREDDLSVPTDSIAPEPPLRPRILQAAQRVGVAY